MNCIGWHLKMKLHCDPKKIICQISGILMSTAEQIFSSVLKIKTLEMYYFLKMFYFWEGTRGGGAERGTGNLKQAPHCQQWARCRAWTHQPRDHVSRSLPLNRLSHPGAPEMYRFLCSCISFLPIPVSTNTYVWNIQANHSLLAEVVAKELIILLGILSWLFTVKTLVKRDRSCFWGLNRRVLSGEWA